MADVTLAIEGMTCSHCVRRVTKALSAVPGVEVKSVVVGRAVLDAGDSAETMQQAIAAVEQAGYPAKAERSGANSI